MPGLVCKSINFFQVYFFLRPKSPLRENRDRSTTPFKCSSIHPWLVALNTHAVVHMKTDGCRTPTQTGALPFFLIDFKSSCSARGRVKQCGPRGSFHVPLIPLPCYWLDALPRDHQSCRPSYSLIRVAPGYTFYRTERENRRDNRCVRENGFPIVGQRRRQELVILQWLLDGCPTSSTLANHRATVGESPAPLLEHALVL